MGNTPLLTESEQHALTQALETGAADQAFRDLATYLKRNDLQLSDDVLRLYAEKELFACFKGRGGSFMTLMET